MVRERAVDIGSGTVRYLEAGAGWPLVLLHAFPLSADMWRPQLEHVPDGWRVLAPDLRGFGPGATRAATTLTDMAEDVVAWLGALHVDSAIIGGLSMGGYLTFVLFRMIPERFTGMILANTKATADTPDGRAARDHMSNLVRTRGVTAVADEMIPKLIGETARTSRPELAESLRRLIERNSADGIDGAIHAMKARTDSTDLLPRVGCPALVVAGEEDSLIPFSESNAMHRLLPRSQIVSLPRAGHLSNMEAPDDFSEALTNFLYAHL